MALLVTAAASAFQPPPPGVAPPAVEARVQGLLKVMSNAEKARQLDMYSGRDFLSNGRCDATQPSNTPAPAPASRARSHPRFRAVARRTWPPHTHACHDRWPPTRFNATKAATVLGGGLGVGRIHDLYAQDPAVANCVDTNCPRGLCTVPKAPCVSYIPEAQGTLPPPRPQALYAHQPRACRT